MTAPRNEHEDIAAYERGGLDAVMGIPRQRALDLAKVLTIKAGGMDQRHPTTAVVRRDVKQIYELLHPEAEPNTPAHRARAQGIIESLQKHPAYSDASHPEHARVAANVRDAYEVFHEGTDE